MGDHQLYMAFIFPDVSLLQFTLLKKIIYDGETYFF